MRKNRSSKWLNTMVARHGSVEAVEEHMRTIGSSGGSKTGVKKGFAAMTPEQRSAAGKKGGRKSRKGSDGTENATTKSGFTPAAHAAV